MQDILQQLSPILGNPALWLAVTLVAFIFGQHLYKLTQFNPLFTPIIVAVVSIIVVLLVMGVPYEQYFQGAGVIHFLLGPEQEVNDACALEVLLVGHAHDEQHDDDAHDGHDDRREERIELRELVEMLAEDKGDERDGKPEGGIAEDRRELLKNVLHGQSLFLFLFLCTSLSTKMMV